MALLFGLTRLVKLSPLEETHFLLPVHLHPGSRRQMETILLQGRLIGATIHSSLSAHVDSQY